MLEQYYYDGVFFLDAFGIFAFKPRIKDSQTGSCLGPFYQKGAIGITM